MAELNDEGFVTYYHNATSGRNSNHYQTIYGCIEGLRREIILEYGCSQYYVYEWIDNNFSLYKKKLKARLMTNGVSSQAATSIIKNFDKWFKLE